MLFKVIIIFLGLMVLVAVVGRVLFPSALPRVLRKKASPPVCIKCGRYLISGSDCGGRGK